MENWPVTSPKDGEIAAALVFAEAWRNHFILCIYFYVYICIYILCMYVYIYTLYVIMCIYILYVCMYIYIYIFGLLIYFKTLVVGAKHAKPAKPVARKLAKQPLIKRFRGSWRYVSESTTSGCAL